MSNALEKIKRYRDRKNKSGGSSSGGGGNGEARLTNTWIKFIKGDNRVRLVGEHLELRTHWVAKSAFDGTEGLCREDSFGWDEGKINNRKINCPNWDVETETAIKTDCPICILHGIAQEALGMDDLEPDEKEYFESLRAGTKPTEEFKWNIFDRANPNITQKTDGVEKEILGYKVPSKMGIEIYESIEKIFDQLDRDITDVKIGVDINIMRDDSGTRTKYTSEAVMEGITAKVTPLTDEELAIEQYDLKKMCGVQTDPSLIKNWLQENLIKLIDSE